MNIMKYSRILKRKCAVCNKNMKIRIFDRKGHYSNGHYFGKVKIPLKGTGKYKKVHTVRILKRKVDVVEWTGKEKKLEYWECNKCYEEALHVGWLEETIEKLFGKRCPDYAKGCPCCEAWNIFDTILKEK